MGRTAALIPAQYAISKKYACGVHRPANGVRIRTRTHCVDVHLVRFAHVLQKPLQARPRYQSRHELTVADSPRLGEIPPLC
jgi:hypothetical protein